jgi:hypothetical protein
MSTVQSTQPIESARDRVWRENPILWTYCWLRTRTRFATGSAPRAAVVEKPGHKLSGLAFLGYVVALLIPAIGLALGVYLRSGRGERFHGTGVMVVAAAMIALCVVATVASH